MPSESKKFFANEIVQRVFQTKVIADALGGIALAGPDFVKLDG
jgi:hypothetical protein